MTLSPDARHFIAILLITIPGVEFGGRFLLSLFGPLGKNMSKDRIAFYRAGHAHAGVLVILAIIGQLLIDASGIPTPLSMLFRVGFVLPPILMPLGFFLGAPDENGKHGPLFPLIYLGAIVLALTTLGFGIKLLLG